MANDDPTIGKFLPPNVPTHGYDPENPFIFKGTEGNMNYVLVAQKGPIILGVRVLVMHFTKEKCVVGFRIRSTCHPHEQVSVAPGVYGSTWGPDVEFKKNVKTHSSFMMMTELNMPPGQWDALPKAMKKGRVISKLIAWLAQNIATEDLVYEQEDLEKVLWAQVAKQVKIKELQGEVFEDTPLLDENGEPAEAVEPTIDPEQPLADTGDVIQKMVLEQLQEQGATINEDGTVTMPEQPDDAPSLEDFSDNIGALLSGLDDDDDGEGGLLPN